MLIIDDIMLLINTITHTEDPKTNRRNNFFLIRFEKHTQKHACGLKYVFNSS